MFYLCSFLNVFEFLLQIFFKDASIGGNPGGTCTSKECSKGHPDWLVGWNYLYFKQHLKLAFPRTQSEGNSKVLNRDNEAPGFKLKI